MATSPKPGPTADPCAPRPDNPDAIDDEWERLAASGCPDWWLFSKYAVQGAARSLSYLAQRSTAPASTAPAGSSGGGGAAGAALQTLESLTSAGSGSARGTKQLLELQPAQPSAAPASAARQQDGLQHEAAGQQEPSQQPHAAAATVSDALPTQPPPPPQQQQQHHHGPAFGPKGCGLFDCTGGGCARGTYEPLRQAAGSGAGGHLQH